MSVAEYYTPPAKANANMGLAELRELTPAFDAADRERDAAKASLDSLAAERDQKKAAHHAAAEKLRQELRKGSTTAQGEIVALTRSFESEQQALAATIATVQQQYEEARMVGGDRVNAENFAADIGPEQETARAKLLANAAHALEQRLLFPLRRAGGAGGLLGLFQGFAQEINRERNEIRERRISRLYAND